MKWACVRGFIAALMPAKHCTTVAAGVEKRVKHTVLVARNEYRLAAHLQGDVVVLLRDLAAQVSRDRNLGNIRSRRPVSVLCRFKRR